MYPFLYPNVACIVASIVIRSDSDWLMYRLGWKRTNYLAAIVCGSVALLGHAVARTNLLPMVCVQDKQPSSSVAVSL